MVPRYTRRLAVLSLVLLAGCLGLAGAAWCIAHPERPALGAASSNTLKSPHRLDGQHPPRPWPAH